MKVFIGLFFLMLFTIYSFGQSPSPSPTPTMENQQVFGNKFQKFYWVGDCGEIYNIPMSGLLYFDSEKDAIDQGFKKAENCTILEKIKPGLTKAEFIGDSETKLFYSLQCDEAGRIKTEKRVVFENKNAGEEIGFKLSDKCTKTTTELQPDSPPASKQSKSSKTKEAPTKLKKTAKAYNLLQVLTYPEEWTDRKIIIKGEIQLGALPDPEEFGQRYRQSFILRDNSATINLVAPESPGTRKLRDLIIANDGYPIEGTFTFILFSEVYKSRNRVGRLEYFKVP